MWHWPRLPTCALSSIKEAHSTMDHLRIMLDRTRELLPSCSFVSRNYKKHTDKLTHRDSNKYIQTHTQTETHTHAVFVERPTVILKLVKAGSKIGTLHDTVVLDLVSSAQHQKPADFILKKTIKTTCKTHHTRSLALCIVLRWVCKSSRISAPICSETKQLNVYQSVN